MVENIVYLDAPCTWSTNWDEKNRFNYKALNIADSGERIATTTGVSFLNEKFLAAAHHASGKVGIFDLAAEANPLYTFNCPFTMDDIASNKLSKYTYEIIVSGNWAANYAIFSLAFDMLTLKPSAKLIGVCAAPTEAGHVPKTFSHSVFYIENSICICLHTGHDPRIDIDHGKSVIRLPRGFYPTGACWDSAKKHIYIGANHQLPTEKAFTGSCSSIWRFEAANRSLNCLIKIDDCHVDSLALCGEKLWFNNQYRNILMSFDINHPSTLFAIRHDSLGFPHGIDIHDNKHLAVANYKPSSIAIFDLSKL